MGSPRRLKAPPPKVTAPRQSPSMAGKAARLAAMYGTGSRQLAKYYDESHTRKPRLQERFAVIKLRCVRSAHTTFAVLDRHDDDREVKRLNSRRKINELCDQMNNAWRATLGDP